LLNEVVVTERGPKVRVIASASTWMEGEALRQLDVAADLPGILLCVGMPDLHPGKGGPVGAAFLSDGFLHPMLVGSDIGCGMGLWTTDLLARKARPDRIAAHMDGLDLPWDGDAGAFLGERGVAPTPHDGALGSPGRGNHFIEWQAIEEIHDGPALKALGIAPERLCLLVHSGSRGLGESILRGVTERLGSAALPIGSEDAVAYLRSHDHAVRWAAANRELCARRALAAAGADGTGVLDVCHNRVAAAAFGGGSCWLHRKGAAPADCGAVVVPGSRGDLSYLVQPTLGRQDALWSLAHGAGRRIARGEARGKLRGRYKRKDLRNTPFGGRVVCGEEALLWEEAPEAYKSAAGVVGDLVSAGLVQLIATLRPRVTFKTSEATRNETQRDDAWKRQRDASRAAKRGSERS
jgi:release factor H-coupled RctB family protein